MTQQQTGVRKTTSWLVRLEFNCGLMSFLGTYCEENNLELLSNSSLVRPNATQLTNIMLAVC